MRPLTFAPPTAAMQSKPAIDAAQAKIPVELICGIYESMKTGLPYVFKR
jgi:hypothetical protein